MSKLSKALKNVNKKPWFQTLKKLAPKVAGGLIGGPFGALAVTTLQSALGVDGDPNDPATLDTIGEMITAGKPETLLALKEGEREFEIRMQELEIEEKDLFLKDVQSAREMQIATMDSTPRNLTYLAAVLLLGIVGAMIWQQEWISTNEFAQNFCYLLVGSSLGWVTQAFNFWLGSSRGSYAKTQAANDQMTQLKEMIVQISEHRIAA